MKTKRKASETKPSSPANGKERPEDEMIFEEPEIPESTSAPAGANTSPPALPSGYKPGSKLTIPLKDDGSVDWDSMRESTKDRVKFALGSAPSVALAVKSEEPIIGEDEANSLLDLLGNVDAMAANAIYKVPQDICAEAFQFLPEHRRKINPPLQRVLNKWMPVFVKTWKDEIGLAIVLSATLNAQVRTMHALDEKRKKNQPQKVTSMPSRTSEPAVVEKGIPKEDWPQNVPEVQSSPAS